MGTEKHKKAAGILSGSRYRFGRWGEWERIQGTLVHKAVLAMNVTNTGDGIMDGNA